VPEWQKLEKCRLDLDGTEQKCNYLAPSLHFKWSNLRKLKSGDITGRQKNSFDSSLEMWHMNEWS